MRTRVGARRVRGNCCPTDRPRRAEMARKTASRKRGSAWFGCLRKWPTLLVCAKLPGDPPFAARLTDSSDTRTEIISHGNSAARPELRGSVYSQWPAQLSRQSAGLLVLRSRAARAVDGSLKPSFAHCSAARLATSREYQCEKPPVPALAGSSAARAQAALRSDPIHVAAERHERHTAQPRSFSCTSAAAVV